MIKAIANQKVEVSQEEYQYYLELETLFGKDAFLNLFQTNSDGQIISVLPSTSEPKIMILIYFLLNVMFNQRIRKLDKFLNKIDSLDQRIKKLEGEDGNV